VAVKIDGIKWIIHADDKADRGIITRRHITEHPATAVAAVEHPPTTFVRIMVMSDAANQHSPSTEDKHLIKVVKLQGLQTQLDGQISLHIPLKY
jgi:hypothetical protein